MAQSVDGHDNSLPACKVEPRDHKVRYAMSREHVVVVPKRN
jgi:transcription factor TGA